MTGGIKKILRDPLVYLALAGLSFILHNAFYAMTKVEEGFFFIGFFVFSFAFVVFSAMWLFGLVSRLIKKKPSKK